MSVFVRLFKNSNLNVESLAMGAGASRHIEPDDHGRTLSISSTVDLRVEIESDGFDGTFTTLFFAGTNFTGALAPSQRYTVTVKNRSTFAADVHISVSS